MIPVRGVYKMANGRWLVKKFGVHIGTYATIEEAYKHAKEAEKERELLR